MGTPELLRQAIHAARGGRSLTARNMFQEVVRSDPNNEVAWMWLSGLLEPLDDRIVACERVLSINPDNQKIRNYLGELHKEQYANHQTQLSENDALVQQVRKHIQNGKQKEAMLLLRKVLARENGRKDAWELFSELSVNIDDKVRAYEAIVQIDSTNVQAQNLLRRFRYYQRNPLELGAYYEEEGKLDEALALYRVLVKESKSSSDFERIYKSIIRLEDIKIDNVQHIKPSFHILRLSIGLPLLYLLEVFMQEGMSPFKYPAPMLWIGIPFVACGSFLVSVAGLPSRHSIWHKWFGEKGGRGSTGSRVVVGLTGWTLVLAPHLLLVLDSVMRLQTFQIPAIPWFK